MLAINVAFFVWFIRMFYKKRPAKVGEVIEQSGNRIQIRDAEMGKQYPQFPDADFGKWYEKHKFTTWMVLLASLCYHHKIAKLYYFRFYMFDMFKARWTQAEQFKKRKANVISKIKNFRRIRIIKRKNCVLNNLSISSEKIAK